MEPTPKTQILIVEDEGIIAKDIQAMLRGLGYHVPTTVGTGEKAIAAAATNLPDLILMDINLRGDIDGVQTATAIAAQQDVPIVYLTANSDEATLQRAKITDPFGFMIKPFEERALHAGIEMALYKHRNEKKTREREQWLSTTLRSIADGVMTTDETGRLNFLNAVAEALLGTPREELLGLHYSAIFSVLDESSRQAASDGIARALEEGLIFSSTNHSILVTRDGLERQIEHSAAPIRQEDGRISGSVIVFSDVTEQRKLETELQQAQKLDAIGRLAGSIAHDFNNALTAIMGYSSLMLARIPEEHSLHGDAGQILRAAEHSASLTRQLLAFSRKQVISPVLMDLGATVRHIHGLLGRLIRENIKLKLSIPKDLWPIEADSGQCEQIVINMAVNARDAMPHGGILEIELQNVSVPPESGDAPCDYVALHIRDNGTGMSQDVIDRIFEPFFTTKPSDRGTGLGLSTCERIVKQAGGFIGITSVVGEGTVFSIHFPRATASASPAQPEVERALAERGAETVLLIEDDDGVRTTTASLLADLGYTVLEAESGRQALEILEMSVQTVDLILSDLLMPEMGGREFVAQAREIFQQAGRPFHVLYISGYTDKDIIGDIASEPSAQFLGKPYSRDVLARAVRNALSDDVAPALVAS